MIEAVALPVEDNAYAKQWATVYLLLSSPANVDLSKVEQILRAVMPEWDFDRFVEYRTVATVKEVTLESDASGSSTVMQWTSGPWAGYKASNPYVTAIKVNARTRQHTPAAPLLPAAQLAMRRAGRLALEKLGYEVVHNEVRPWGSAPLKGPDELPTDRGLPVTPPLPSPELPPVEEKSNAWVWWLLLGTATATAYAYSRKT
jgi:hypothetical protein